MNHIDHHARELTGLVLSCRHPVQASSFCLVTLGDGSALRGQLEPGTLVIGQCYRFHGSWIEHSEYGLQFNFLFCYQVTPVDRAGIVAYLTRTCQGITKAQAGKLFERYGEEAVLTLRMDPQGASEAAGIDGAVAMDASLTLLSLAETETARLGLYQLFAGRGFPKATIEGCIKKWGNKAADKVIANPFRLLLDRVPGCGFKRVDPLYLSIGGDPRAIQRQTYAGWAEMAADTSGNTWSLQGVFYRGVEKNLPAGTADPDKAMKLGIRNGLLKQIADGAGTVWLAETRRATNEAALAYHLARLGSCPDICWPEVFDDRLTKHQSEAWSYLRQYPVCFLTGTPGTGKTFTAAAILGEIVRKVSTSLVAVCAPTGKAAVRIQENLINLGLRLEASTIHRLLACQPGSGHGKAWEFNFNETNKLSYKYLVCDEVSMLDTDLAADLLRACADGTHILFLGDPYQLPPVGHGSPLRDCLAANVPSYLLTEVKRNAGAIVDGCASLRRGEMFKTFPRPRPDAGENLVLVDCFTEEEQLTALRGLVGALVAKGKCDPFLELQVICPRNEDSLVARKNLNLLMQNMLNPERREEGDSMVGPFRLRDKVICLSNTWIQLWEKKPRRGNHHVSDYRSLLDQDGIPQKVLIANGDQGRVLALDPTKGNAIFGFSAPRRIVKVQLGKKNSGGKGEAEARAEDFSLAYAITGHKSQGSEWPIGIIMADPACGRVASREWWTTAISRFQKVAYILGNAYVIEKQIARCVLPERKTFLKELILEEIPNELLGPKLAANPH